MASWYSSSAWAFAPRSANAYGTASLASRTAASLRVARGQFAPRHQRRLHLALGGSGPAEAEQRLVRVHPRQPHPFQVGACRLASAFLQRREAERDIRLVAQASVLLARGGQLADLVEQLRTARQVTASYQGHAEVVADVARRTGALGEHIQHLDRLGVLATRHQDVGLQQRAVLFQCARQRFVDASQRVLGLRIQAALVADLGEVVPGAVAHRRRRPALDQFGEYLAGLAVHAVRQEQPAAQDLGFIVVRHHAAELL